jgi:hypothetical protein
LGQDSTPFPGAHPIARRLVADDAWTVHSTGHPVTVPVPCRRICGQILLGESARFRLCSITEVQEEVGCLDRQQARDSSPDRENDNHAPEDPPDRTQMHSGCDRLVPLVTMRQHRHARILILLKRAGEWMRHT